MLGKGQHRCVEAPRTFFWTVFRWCLFCARHWPRKCWVAGRDNTRGGWAANKLRQGGRDQRITLRDVYDFSCLQASQKKWGLSWALKEGRSPRGKRVRVLQAGWTVWAEAQRGECQAFSEKDKGGRCSWKCWKENTATGHGICPQGPRTLG